MKKIYFANRICRPIGKILLKILYHPKIIGHKKIPKKGPLVLVGNHTHDFDCVLLFSTTKRTIRFMAKNTLFKGWKKYFLNSYGAIPVHRDRKDPDSLKKAIEVLNQGGVIGIFPEGTINKTNDIIMPFKFGAVKMAKETNATIVPFSITGKYKKDGNITICFEEPYKIESDDLEKENQILMNKVTELIINNKGV